MIDPLFYEAWVHKEHQVLGCTLHELSALDILALEFMESPFLLNDVDLDAPGLAMDLIHAVWVLSTDHDKGCRVPEWKTNPEPVWAMDCLFFLEDREILKEEIKAYFRYFNDYFSLPQISRDIGGHQSTPLGCPWLLSRVASAPKQLGISLYEAWTMDFGMLVWYQASLEEMETSSRVVSPEMRKRMASAQKELPLQTPAEAAASTGLSEATLKLLIDSASALNPKPEVVYTGPLPPPNQRVTVEKLQGPRPDQIVAT